MTVDPKAAQNTEAEDSAVSDADLENVAGGKIVYEWERNRGSAPIG